MGDELMNSTNLQDQCGNGYHPRGLLLQWHITERCNRRCAHCYQDGYSGEELPFPDLIKVLDQYTDLLKFWRNGSREWVRGHITVTGGEPFVRKDFLNLLEVFAANRKSFSFSILSNGDFINVEMAARLRTLGPTFVQVSIEGTKATHDKIRGEGSYDRVASAIKNLVRQRICTLISFTVHRTNFREFPDVVRLGRRLGVNRVWSDRLIPRGAGSALHEGVLTPEETWEFFTIMQKARRKSLRYLFNRTEVAMFRALQFMESPGRPYYCTAGDSLITVQPNGDLYPCRRMPVRVGNLMETPLSELYYHSNLFNELRDRNRVSKGCETCSFSEKCRGGLKCLSFAVTGDPFTADPGCWVSSQNELGISKLLPEPKRLMVGG